VEVGYRGREDGAGSCGQAGALAPQAAVKLAGRWLKMGEDGSGRERERERRRRHDFMHEQEA
jgi:hypothetical protein